MKHQNKIDYQKRWPSCIKCGKPIKHKTGETISRTAYESLNGICNGCSYESNQNAKKEVKQNDRG